MPKLAGKVPVFLQSLRDNGWAAAKKKQGGNVAKVVATYLAELTNKNEIEAWVVSLGDIPQSSALKQKICLHLFRKRLFMRLSTRSLFRSLGVITNVV